MLKKTGKQGLVDHVMIDVANVHSQRYILLTTYLHATYVKRLYFFEYVMYCGTSHQHKEVKQQRNVQSKYYGVCTRNILF